MDIQIDVGKVRPQGGPARALAGAQVTTMASIMDQLHAIKDLAGAQDFAVFRITAPAARPNAQLSLVLTSSLRVKDGVVDLIEAAFGAALVSHMETSLMPVIWHSQDGHGGRAGRSSNLLTADMPRIAAQSRSVDFDGIAFPVKLGALGNGVAVFYGAAMPEAGERVLEMHRKSYRVLKGLLGIELKKSAPRQNLNDRELECLQFAGEGLKSELIAEKLDLSVHTVNAYLGSATAKLDSVNRIQAIAKAIRLGYLA